MATPDKKPDGGKPRSSMAVGKKEICRDAACIADLEGEAAINPARQEADMPSENGDRGSSSSSMTFGEKEGCKDEECIGIK